MKKLILRLDDACPKRDVEKWNKIEFLLDKYLVKPLVGIIPDCKDPEFEKYPEDMEFWSRRVPAWVFVVTSILSLLTTYILRCIPFVRKYIL